jgi:hypothetical protein
MTTEFASIPEIITIIHQPHRCDRVIDPLKFRIVFKKYSSPISSYEENIYCLEKGHPSFDLPQIQNQKLVGEAMR